MNPRALGDPSIEDAWAICSDLFCRATEVRGSKTLVDIQRELLFCLLGGFGITYELNASATRAISGLRPFTDAWSAGDLVTAIESELLRPQFEPRRRDGTLRRYRYPHRKASLIASARAWLANHGSLATELASLSSNRERRLLLCNCPGIGEKTASWLLRNLGWGQDLAVLDVHVLRALQNSGRIEEVRLPRDYAIVEKAFLDWCHELDAPPAAFDLFVWEWQRGTLMPA